MLTNSQINKLNDQMRSIDPVEAWINATASALRSSAPDERAWTPEDMVGSTGEVTIPNGLEHGHYQARLVRVIVTPDMVTEARRRSAITDEAPPIDGFSTAEIKAAEANL